MASSATDRPLTRPQLTALRAIAATGRTGDAARAVINRLEAAGLIRYPSPGYWTPEITEAGRAAIAVFDGAEFAVPPVTAIVDEAGCSCGWRGSSDDVEDHPCPLPDPQDLLDCCGHPRERHYGEYGDGVPRCEFCDCSVRSW